MDEVKDELDDKSLLRLQRIDKQLARIFRNELSIDWKEGARTVEELNRQLRVIFENELSIRWDDARNLDELNEQLNTKFKNELDISWRMF